MATDYAKNLEFILKELHQTTPTTVAKLEALRATYGPTTVFYVAYVVLCLQIHADRYGIGALEMVTRQEIMGYMYFEQMKDRADAWELLEDVLRCFCSELSVDCLSVLAHG